MAISFIQIHKGDFTSFSSTFARLALVRAQSKDTWDPRFTAKAPVNYIRAGFDMVPLE